MKTSKMIRSAVTAGVVAAAAMMFTGCATTPADRAAALSKDVAQTGKNLKESSKAVSQCLTALTQLTGQPSGDLRSQYKSYLSEVKKLGKVSDKVDTSVTAMMEGSHVYFADWENQIAAISDSAIRKLSEDRKEQAVENLAELKRSIDKSRAGSKPLVNELNDIGTYLGNNLTVEGIAAMKSRLEKLKTEALSAREDTDKAVVALNKYSASLSTPAPSKKD